MTDPFAEKTAHWPADAQSLFAQLRAVILAAAADMDAGPIQESLKWGQPAWRPERPRQGSTLRADWQAKSPQALALFVDCKTTLAQTMREVYPSEFTYENNRAILLDMGRPAPLSAVDHLARLTFGYHRRG